MESYNKNKIVIFVGGTSYSGSTMFDMMLASHPKAISLGEVYAIFRPYRKHHFQKLDELIKNPLWSSIIKGGSKDLYSNIFQKFPEIDIIIDSSKNPFWINAQQKQCSKKFNTKNVLIWKDPADLAYSFYRRGEYHNFNKSIKSYYASYFKLLKIDCVVNYKKLVINQSYLPSICEQIEIEFFPEMLDFWKKDHHTFFGNNNTRRHISQKDNFYGNEKLSDFGDTPLKKLSYKKPDDQFLSKVYFESDDIKNIIQFIRGEKNKLQINFRNFLIIKGFLKYILEYKLKMDFKR